jgi:single-strand DNA-binding protein
MSTASLNECRLIGNVGADPKGRTTDGGKRVVTLSVATTSYSGDREFTEWHRVVFWGALAERVEKYVRKGTSIYVGGRLQSKIWTDKEGAEHRNVDIVADALQLLGAGKSASGARDDSGAAAQAATAEPSEGESEGKGRAATDESDPF